MKPRKNYNTEREIFVPNYYEKLGKYQISSLLNLNDAQRLTKQTAIKPYVKNMNGEIGVKVYSSAKKPKPFHRDFNYRIPVLLALLKIIVSSSDILSTFIN